MHVYGSELTGFQTPSSDIDVAVLNITSKKVIIVIDFIIIIIIIIIYFMKNVIELLYDLADMIKRKLNITYIEVIATAKVPIIKFDHVNDVSIDVVLNNDSGIITGNLLKEYATKFPMLRPLTLVLKVFMSQRYHHNHNHNHNHNHYYNEHIVASNIASHFRFLIITSAFLSLGVTIFTDQARNGACHFTTVSCF